jgi:hypothetical protein
MGVNDLVPRRPARTLAAGAPTTTPTRWPSVIALLALAGILGACASGGAAASASAAASSVPTTIESASEAAGAVAQQNRLLAGIGPLESDAIGQANYWDAESTEDGYRVRYTLGWGDCLAGCIESHEFTYEVSRAGSVRLVAEDGDVIPADVVDKLSDGGGGGIAHQGVTGRVVAGPVCPAEQPNDPACDPRPVPGAVIVVRSADGSEVRIQADESGLFALELAAGDYILEPQPVDGYMAAPQPIAIAVEEGTSTEVELEYDTGIR